MPIGAWARWARLAGAPISSVMAFGDVAETLLVLGQDALQELDPLLAAGLRIGLDALRAALTATSTSAAVRRRCGRTPLPWRD